MKPLIEVENVGKSYRIGDTSVPVLEHISFTVNAGESIAIVGPSGSGKSTLLAMMAGIDSVSNGVIRVGGHLITGLTESQLAAVRARLMGFVFQSYRLIPSLTA
ncbi:ATP-binding cassette domain-containing protein, partial [bacterium]|nr:ATP-binding cassette domain-containing protein [bacterium]